MFITTCRIRWYEWHSVPFCVTDDPTWLMDYQENLIQDIFDQLQGARVFTCLDLKAAYNQISVSEQDIPKTAFICHRGLFEYLRMPFGLCNAPAVFQRTVESVLHGLVGTACFVY